MTAATSEATNEATNEAASEALGALDGRAPAEWPALLRARFPDDPGLVRQLLLWHTVHREQAIDHSGPGPRGLAALGTRGRYELAARLDVGATASVWRAYDRTLRRNVAIKVFDGRSSEAVDGILAEARAACEVISEHVVRVLDVHQAEPPYIVMELVGEHHPRTGALEPAVSAATCRPRDLQEAMRWVRDVARGVHDAHLRNVFHRDLKPHNVLITPISRRAKIADFGLAVSSSARAVASPRPGMIVGTGGVAARIAGTPGYMAPEQARGLALALDPQRAADRATLVGVDVWGLGAIAYDLVSGHPPWSATDAIAAWEAAASGASPAPLDRAPSGERIPHRLRRIIERALAGTPDRRYPCAGELADELHAWLTCRPTSFDGAPATRVALWSRRNPQLTITAVLAVALAGMSFAAYATVVRLHAQRGALAAEVQAAVADKERLAEQAGATRRELETTERTLRGLRRSLAEAEAEYRVIVQAREQALHSASMATQALAAARGERDVAEKTRELYELLWARSRKEAEDAAHERDQAGRERDAARANVEQAVKERDEARAARLRAEHDRDVAQADRDRDARARRQAEEDIARLIGELSAAVIRDGARTATEERPAAEERPGPTEPAKGAVH
jgi:hypothetical protein